MYDYRGIDGTGTEISPATGANAVSYTVRKLADGNCWMTQNLKLTLVKDKTYEVGTFMGGTNSWTIQASEVDTSSANPYNIAISYNTKPNLNTNASINAKNGGNAWYYPWYAATAGQGTQTSNPSITQSICPKGWRLPLNTGDKSFYNLTNIKYGVTNSATGATMIQNTPLDFTMSGRTNGGSQLDVNTSGNYWSATPYTSNANYAYYLRYNSGGISFQDYTSKFYGYSVRCVAL